MQVYCPFYVYAQAQKDYTGPGSVVDVCLRGMVQGTLPVTAKERGYALWEFYVLSVDQWVRMCALMQHHRLPSRLCWALGTNLCWTRRGAVAEPTCTWVFEDSDAVAALSRIEFLWQDLDAVQAYLHEKISALGVGVEWVAVEVARRRQWFTGLRRAWVLATSA